MSVPPTGAVTHPRLVPRRSGATASWWARAWSRAVEEAAFGERDLRAGRSAARRGLVGAITVGPGSLLAAVREGDDAWTVTVEVPVLDDVGAETLVEVVAAEAGRLPALLAGDLPHGLVEHAEESGVEVLPYGGELATTCTCPAPLDPCPHSLAVLTQAGWLLDAEPLVLLALRGLPRDELMARLHRRTPVGPGPADAPARGALDGDGVDDVEVALDAVLRARRVVDLLDAGHDVPDHLW